LFNAFSPLLYIFITHTFDDGIFGRVSMNRGKEIKEIDKKERSKLKNILLLKKTKTQKYPLDTWSSFCV